MEEHINEGRRGACSPVVLYETNLRKRKFLKIFYSYIVSLRLALAP